MATAEEVKKLAALARIKIDDAELSAFTKDFEAIVAYVESISKLEIPQGDALRDGPVLKNVMREDGEPHATGAYTGQIAAQFPARKGDALSVKQIITHE